MRDDFETRHVKIQIDYREVAWFKTLGVPMRVIRLANSHVNERQTIDDICKHFHLEPDAALDVLRYYFAHRSICDKQIKCGENNPVFCFNGEDFCGYMSPCADGTFQLLPGSKIREKVAPTCSEKAVKKRERLRDLEAHRIKHFDGSILVVETWHDSMRTVTDFVCGYPNRGFDKWRETFSRQTTGLPTFEEWERSDVIKRGWLGSICR